MTTPLQAPPLSTRSIAAATTTALAVLAYANFYFFDVVFFVPLLFTSAGKRGGGLGSLSPGPPPAFLTDAIAGPKKSNCH